MFLVCNEMTEQMVFTMIHSSCGENFLLCIFYLCWILEDVLPLIFRQNFQ